MHNSFHSYSNLILTLTGKFLSFLTLTEKQSVKKWGWAVLLVNVSKTRILLLLLGFLLFMFQNKKYNKFSGFVYSANYCERRDHPSQSYGTPKKRNKILNIGRRTILYRTFFYYFFNFESIPHMNRPSPNRPGPAQP